MKILKSSILSILILFTSAKGKTILIESSCEHFVLESNIKEYSISSNKKQLSIDDLNYNSEPGKPQLPVDGVLLSIPANAKYEIIILDEEKEVLNNIYIAPNPTPILNSSTYEYVDNIVYEITEDKNIYQANNYYPERIIELDYLGFMRDQYLLRVKINVTQFNPILQSIIIYKRLKFILKQVNPGIEKLPDLEKSNTRSKERSDVYERIFEKQVLNYNNTFEDQVSGLNRILNTSSKEFGAVEFYKKIVNRENAKLTINENGIYKLTYNDLESSKFSISTLNPEHLHLYNRGIEIPIFIDGEQDGKFDALDYILFYGEKNNTIFSNDNIYWLVAEETNGKRVQQPSEIKKINSIKLKVFEDRQHFEKDLLYKGYQKVITGSDHWMWEEIEPANEKEIDILLSDISDQTNAQNARISILLYGYEVGSSFAYKDYQVKLYLNNHELIDTTWIDEKEIKITKQIPHTILNDGINKIKIKSLLNSNTDNIYVDWIEVAYSRKLKASDNKLEFTYEKPGNYSFVINNFSSDSIIVWQTSKAGDQFLSLKNERIQQDSSFSLVFNSDINDTTNFICLTANQILTTKNMGSINCSNLYSTSNKSDYIIIAHELFIESVYPLAEFHQNENLSTSIINIQDVYDEFNYGIFNPQAIKDFLQYAYYNWQSPAPFYVLLVGDASYDYKNNLSTDNNNFVPTHLFEAPFFYIPAYSETASDNWFACVSGDDVIPDILVGRLAVRKPEEVNHFIMKMQRYCNDFTKHDWKQNVLIVADDTQKKENFEALSDSLASLIPPNYNVTKLYLRDINNASTMKDQIISSINSGNSLLCYVGHGGVDLWAQERILKVEHLIQLANGHKLPFHIAFSCSTGMFQHAERESMAETLISAENSGCIAAWAATGSPFLHNHIIFGQFLLQNLFQSQEHTFGEMIANTVLEYISNFWYITEVPMMYVLFGDPALYFTKINPTAPEVNIFIDNKKVVESDYVAAEPLITAEINALSKIKENSIRVVIDDHPLESADQRIEYVPIDKTSGTVLYQDSFEAGTHKLRIIAVDSTGATGEDRIAFQVAEQLKILNVLNYPNPMQSRTNFTYTLTQPAEVIIKVYTISGRLIKTIRDYSNASFNMVEWDGLDGDGDRIANGVYLYKVIAKQGDKSIGCVERLVKME